MISNDNRMRWDAVLSRLPEDRSLEGVEVGVWRGELSGRLLAARPRLTLSMVDLWTHESMGRRQAGVCPPAECLKLIESLQRRHPGRGLRMRAESRRAAQSLADASLDFAFIDAKHNYVAVSRDIRSWLPKVCPGGWIGGHDYGHARFPGVRQAVDEAFAGQQIETDADDTWFVRVA